MTAGRAAGQKEKAMTKVDQTVEQLFAAEISLSRQRVTVAAGADGVRAEAGADRLASALAGGNPPPSSPLGAVLAELEELDAAIDSARAQRRDEIVARRQAEADEVRARATTLRSEAAELRAMRDRLIAELVELEGVPFEPAQRLVEIQGVPSTVPLPTRSEQMAEEAAGIEHQAQAIAARPPTDSIEVHGDDLDVEGVLALIEAQGPMVLGPRLDDVAAWVAPRLAAAEKRRAAEPPIDLSIGPKRVSVLHGRDAREAAIEEALVPLDWEPFRAPIRVRIVSRGGALDEQGSTVTIPAFDDVHQFAQDLRVMRQEFLEHARRDPKRLAAAEKAVDAAADQAVAA